MDRARSKMGRFRGNVPLCQRSALVAGKAQRKDLPTRSQIARQFGHHRCDPASLKKDRIYKNRDLAVTDVSDYIDSFYNRVRRHRHLGGVSPEEFEISSKRA
jgi:transposase InsO family protein